MSKKLLITILSLCFFAFSSFAQNISFYSCNDGLSSTEIHKIYQDSKNTIWITTKNGLNRYDGLKFNNYSHKANDPNSLMCNETTCVFEYDPNHILVGTASGLQCYCYDTDKFTSLMPQSPNGPQISFRVVSFERLSSGKVIMCYAGRGSAEITVDEDGTIHSKFINDFDAEGTNPYYLFEYKKDKLFVLNSQGHLYRKTGKSFKKFENITDGLKLCTSSSGKLYLATVRNGIFYYDDKADEFVQKTTGLATGFAFGFNSWGEGRMFVCTDGDGLRIYDENTGEISQSTIRVNDFNLNTSNVKDAIEDRFKNVWVGVYWRGVMMKAHSNSVFEYIGRHSITKNSIGTNSVTALASAKDGKLWVATDNSGLYLMDGEGKSSIHYSQETIPSMPRSFTCMANTSTGLILGTFFDGLWTMNNGVFTCVDSSINSVFDIKDAGNGWYWIATIGNGLYLYNSSTKESVRYQTNYNPDDANSNVLTNNYVTCIYVVKNKLFVSTTRGIDICSIGAGNQLKRVKSVCPSATCNQFALSGDGKTLWAASNIGLISIDVNSYKTEVYNVDDGLPNDNVESLCVCGDNIWLGTDNGLSAFSISKKCFVNYRLEDGIQNNQFSRNSVLKSDGVVYIGGISGITYFNPKRLHELGSESKVLDLHFVDFVLAGKSIHMGDMSGKYEIISDYIDNNPEINLSHHDNHFLLYMKAYGESFQGIIFEYSIDGGEWKNQGVSNRLVFDNLTPRRHIVKFRARYQDAVSEERTLVVNVHPEWYASGWAKIVYFLIILVVFWLLYQYYNRQKSVRRVIERHKKEQELMETRTQFFMNISHEIRTPMTLIISPIDKLLSSDTDPERLRSYNLIKQNANRILRLVSQMMDVRKIEQGKYFLDYKKVELVSFLYGIYEVFETNASSRNITYNYVHDTEKLFVYLDPENVDKIVMNLLSNAFKFTADGGKITLELKGIQDVAEENGEATKGAASSFMISVTDNGVGIPLDCKEKVFERFYSDQHSKGTIGTGIGLNLTSLLVKLHNGTITVLDNPEERGTRFEVSLPVGDESLCDKGGVTTEYSSETPIVVDHAEAPSKSSSLDKSRVLLLVEDDEAIREYVRSSFSDEFVIKECSNGQEAWDYVVNHKEKVGIILSDVMMPVMDGMTLCQKVKANFTTNHIPVILMSALSSDNDRIAGITNGADAYVSKPFNIDVLRASVKNLLKSRHILQSKFTTEVQTEKNIKKVEMESPDEAFMRRLMKVINDNLDNSEITVEEIADKVGLSRVHFYRKVKDLTGQVPRDFLRYVRLKEAARLLRKNKMDITGISVATGFKTPSAFSSNFKALYGMPPSEWAKGAADDDDSDDVALPQSPK